MEWGGSFSLLKDTEGETGFVSVPAEEILYFCVQHNQIIAHTEDAELYTGWDSLDRLWRAIKATDSRFYRTDRVFIANLSKVVKLDREWCKLYFQTTPDAKFCYVARSKLSEVATRIIT
jgi:DNA-binding LytR/AlgR family response regulator